MTDKTRIHVRCNQSFVDALKKLAQATGNTTNDLDSSFKKGVSRFVRSMLQENAIYIKSTQMPVRINKNNNRSNFKQLKDLSEGLVLTRTNAEQFDVGAAAQELPRLDARVHMLDPDVTIKDSSNKQIHDPKISAIVGELIEASEMESNISYNIYVEPEQKKRLKSKTSKTYGMRELLTHIISTSYVYLDMPQKTIDHRAIRLKKIYDTLNEQLIGIHEKKIADDMSYRKDLAVALLQVTKALENEIAKSKASA